MASPKNVRSFLDEKSSPTRVEADSRDSIRVFWDASPPTSKFKLKPNTDILLNSDDFQQESRAAIQGRVADFKRLDSATTLNSLDLLRTPSKTPTLSKRRRLQHWSAALSPPPAEADIEKMFNFADRILSNAALGSQRDEDSDQLSASSSPIEMKLSNSSKKFSRTNSSPSVLSGLNTLKTTYPTSPTKKNRTLKEAKSFGNLSTSNLSTSSTLFETDPMHSSNSLTFCREMKENQSPLIKSTFLKSPPPNLFDQCQINHQQTNFQKNNQSYPNLKRQPQFSLQKNRSAPISTRSFQKQSSSQAIHKNRPTIPLFTNSVQNQTLSVNIQKNSTTVISSSTCSDLKKQANANLLKNPSTSTPLNENMQRNEQKFNNQTIRSTITPLSTDFGKKLQPLIGLQKHQSTPILSTQSFQTQQTQLNSQNNRLVPIPTNSQKLGLKQQLNLVQNNNSNTPTLKTQNLCPNPQFQNSDLPPINTESFLSDWEEDDPENLIEILSQYDSMDLQNSEFQPKKIDYRRFLVLGVEWKSQDEMYVTGDYVNVIGEFSSNYLPKIDITNASNLIILHPDILITTTNIAESFSCLRRAVIQSRLRFTNKVAPPMIFGNIIHQLMQFALENNIWEVSKLTEEAGKLIESNLQEIYAAGIDEKQALESIIQSVPLLRNWNEKYWKDASKGIKNYRTAQQQPLSVSKLLDIEEHIWSPKYGMKGNIDASVQFRVNDPKIRKNGVLVNTTNRIGPLELKTGSPYRSTSHHAQTILYTLLMSDRYGMVLQCIRKFAEFFEDIPIESGLLCYIKSVEMSYVPALRDEIRGLIVRRNSIASYSISKNRNILPKMANNPTCKDCFSINTCATKENGSQDSSGLGILFNQKTGHLQPHHSVFLKKWDELITLEEGDMEKNRKEIWLFKSDEREQLGRCFSNMIILKQEALSTTSAFSSHNVTFAKSSKKFISNSYISVGDPIVVSVESGTYAVAVGFVTALSPKEITVMVDRKVHAPLKIDTEDTRTQGGVLIHRHKSTQNPLENSYLFRIDKDELISGMALLRGNLISLFLPDEGSDSDPKRRKLIVDLEVPRFLPLEYPETLPKNLNPDQKSAVQKVLMAQDYALILGMPGTGKTTTIAIIIQTLVARGKSVLLTSYTHTAVDNVLLKLKESHVDFLRLGNRDKIHSGLHQYIPNFDGSLTTVDEYRALFENKKVVATTCLGINHVIFTKRKFDYCIVDEASQLTLPVCLGPLRFADIFVLVGDHYQLPPLVRNQQAVDSGMSVSLFKLLSETHASAIVCLRHQYRMNSDILLVSNTLVYNHRLICGSDDVAQQKFTIPRLDELHKHIIPDRCENCWLSCVLQPQPAVVFLDTDSIPAMELRVGDVLQNEIEAKLIFQLVETMLLCGSEEGSIGVISPYRSQLKEIKNLLNHRKNVEMHTIDKYQGRDKDCIIVSMVRSNNAKK
ncbi:Tripartite DNA replication factor, partial [Nowakowskiella sp. JEL0078]